MLDFAKRMQTLEELEETNVTTTDNANREAWPEDIDKEIINVKIINGLREAERKVLKSMESLRMLSSLQKANVVHVSKNGDIILLNPDTEAFTNYNIQLCPGPEETEVVTNDILPKQITYYDTGNKYSERIRLY